MLAGTAGTASLTLAYAVERRLRRSVKGPLDYDDSLVPGEIVATAMHLPHVTAREDRELGLILRWSYGSAFGVEHGLLRRRMPEPWASVGFGATLMTATLTLFPLLGRTPVPWRVRIKSASSARVRPGLGREHADGDGEWVRDYVRDLACVADHVECRARPTVLRGS